MTETSDAGARVNGKTQVIALLAWPASHVRTPGFFNAMCARRGINAIMVPWAVGPDDLKTAWEGLRRVDNLAGMILTIPHKQTAAGLCDVLEGDALALGVANTIRRNDEGTFTGRIYDGLGFVEGLLRAGIELRGRRVLMIGAGGAATSIALSLARQDIGALTIANRDAAKGQRLADMLAHTVPGIRVRTGHANAAGHDVIVNATSLGLKPDDPLPCDLAGLEAGAVVADVVMQPAVTRFLEDASRRGARIHKGERMVDAQLDLFVEFLLSGGSRGQ
ncbi:shikimate dehydrogenase family protein [Pararobbsia silviterrae]|uniref:shikimate dehydrogenase (NADP(+)) n=1 Tax=Pararobbsia silviterrae TaxID=1792498 RepID=A0A494Y623_9BURK|nr:shikimate dehydrogenase [Pararobbsia silviterrae]RKP57743.1 shikimate dehydrogenase [Pararobbsia silviterrae]